jgi:hypothetical protein
LASPDVSCSARGKSQPRNGAALHRDNQIVGFLMAESDGQKLDLSYGGVRAGHRGQHIFPKLVKKMMAKGVPLTATVMHSNEANMLSRLLKLGFTKDDLAP